MKKEWTIAFTTTNPNLEKLLQIPQKTQIPSTIEDVNYCQWLLDLLTNVFPSSPKAKPLLTKITLSAP